MKKSDVFSLVWFLGGLVLAGTGLVLFFFTLSLPVATVSSAILSADSAMIILGAVATAHGFRGLTAK